MKRTIWFACVGLCTSFALSVCLQNWANGQHVLSAIHPIPMSSHHSVQKDIPQVDHVVNDFMNAYDIPGLSLAITKNGKLVYARSYGWADRSAEEKVTNHSLFRIASLSKAITAVAIMKLVESGKLSLEDKVFGSGHLLGTSYGTTPYGPHIADITVNQLLHHTCSGWANDGNDPMFRHPEMGQAALISWTLDNQPLNYAPGTHYAYSNFGYCVLGRVIEKISGESYAQFVREHVLEPAGIHDMKISGNTLDDRILNEVVYYGQNGEDPYIYNISRMDSHGGWLATATDLARLLVSIDGFDTKPDILKPSSIKMLTTPSAANPNYACGLSVNSADNWWHTGSLPGTATEMVRTSGGYCWVILCNTRSEKPGFFGDMDALIWKAVNDPTTQWPHEDQF